MNRPAATPPAGTADLREAIETALHDALSPYVALSRWTRGGYASNLAVDALLAGPVATLRERAEKAERERDEAQGLANSRLDLMWKRCLTNEDREAIATAKAVQDERRESDERAARNVEQVRLHLAERQAAESRLATLAAENEALRERAAKICEDRADYFDRAPGYRSWKDAAGSYRATAKEIRTALTQGGSDAA